MYTKKQPLMQMDDNKVNLINYMFIYYEVRLKSIFTNNHTIWLQPPVVLYHCPDISRTLQLF